MPTAVLKPIADGYYRVTGGSTEYTKVQTDDDVYINSDATLRAFTFICEDMPGGAVSVQAVRVNIRFKLVGGSNHLGPGPRCRYAGVDYDVDANDDGIADAGERTWPYTLTPPAGGWTPAVVSQTEFGFQDVQDSPTGGVFSIDLFSVEVDYQGVGAGAGASREVASRVLLLGRRPVQTAEFEGGLALADLEPGRVLAVTHEEGPSPEVGGWGPESWERRPFMVLGSSVVPGTARAKLRGLDVSQYVYLRSLWNTYRTREAFSAEQQGVARLDTGALTEMLRDSQGFVQNAPDGVWRRAEKNVERVGLNGIYLEPERKNELAYSSFRDGYGSGSFWTWAGGTGGSIANDADVLWFDPKEGIRYSARITCGTGASTLTSSNTASIPANSKVVVSVYHLESTTTGIWAVRIIRNVDGWYWDEAAAGWTATVTNNSIPCSTSRAVWASKVIDVGTNATTLKVVYRANTVVPGAQFWVFHGQIEIGEWPSTPIETVDATAVTRSQDILRIYTTNPPHVWPLERGTLWCDFIPDWNSADLTTVSGSRTLLALPQAQAGSGSSEVLRYNQSGNAVRFVRVVQGTSTTAGVNGPTLVRGTKYRFVARWCGAVGEWGMAPYTLSVWFGTPGGTLTKGTDGVAGARNVPQATRSLYIGSGGVASQPLGGQLSNLGITPLCLPDWAVEDL